MVESEWEIIPDADEAKEMETKSESSCSIDTNSSLVGNASSTLYKSDTFDSQGEQQAAELVYKSPKHNRYNSPLFQELLAPPIDVIKISKQSIPDDKSISNLLNMASLITNSQTKLNALVADNSQLLTTNTTNNNAPAVHILNDYSEVDPEKVLTENFVPGIIENDCPKVLIQDTNFYNQKLGSIAEREHMKWINAAPIANNPYSTEALQRRLSETDHKTKVMGISNNKLVDKLVEESQGNEGDAENDDEPMQNIYEAKQKEIKRFEIKLT